MKNDALIPTESSVMTPPANQESTDGNLVDVKMNPVAIAHPQVTTDRVTTDLPNAMTEFPMAAPVVKGLNSMMDNVTSKNLDVTSSNVASIKLKEGNASSADVIANTRSSTSTQNRLDSVMTDTTMEIPDAASGLSAGSTEEDASDPNSSTIGKCTKNHPMTVVQSSSDSSSNKSYISSLVSELVETSIEAQPGEVIYPPVNSEIQVLWELHNDETGKFEQVWWSAQVQGSETRPGQERVHFILYVAHAEFAEEVARVRFLPNYELEDLSSNSWMVWRMAPTRTEAPAQNETQDKSNMSIPELVMKTMSSVMTEDRLEALSKLPAAQQIDVAARYRSLMDNMKEEIEKLLESRGDGTLVTEDDLMSIFRRLTRQERTTR